MTLELMRTLSFTWVVVAVALVGTSAFLRLSDGDITVGVAIVVILGAFVLLAIGWVRQRPIKPDDEATYLHTSMLKLALAEGIGLIGFALAVTLGPWWLSAVGAGFSLVGLAMSLPSEADRERHELLYLV
ncbi:MAG: hypothetical protein ACR2OI_01395 [Acidimicrobiia bacterium]